jgi:hypothetical protein
MPDSQDDAEPKSATSINAANYGVREIKLLPINAITP